MKSVKERHLPDPQDDPGPAVPHSSGQLIIFIVEQTARAYAAEYIKY